MKLAWELPHNCRHNLRELLTAFTSKAEFAMRHLRSHAKDQSKGLIEFRGLPVRVGLIEFRGLPVRVGLIELVIKAYLSLYSPTKKNN